jgi:hypothetical protein
MTSRFKALQLVIRPANLTRAQQHQLRKLCRINQVCPGFFTARFAGSMGRMKPGACMSRTGQSQPLRLKPQAMSLDEAPNDFSLA